MSNLKEPITTPVIVDTPSLKVAGAEPIPDEIVRDLLRQAWIPTPLAPLPHIVIATDVPRPASNNAAADVVSVQALPARETYRGHQMVHVDITIPLRLEIIVPLRHGRQRLYNLMAMIRDIVHRHQKVLVPYHQILYDGFEPSYELVNVHQGTVTIRLASYGVPAIGRVVQGMEVPSTSPDHFPLGLQE